ncbi:RASEF protein, partial [Burhinus bistriatus]|nr:RASEF protein [Burhinus bistriatus]
LCGAFCEDAMSLQGAAGPAGDGGGEPGICKLRQDAAVRLSLAGQLQGQLGTCSCLGWGGAIAVGAALPWVGPLLPTGLRLLPPTRTMNRTLCESNISLRSALLLSTGCRPPSLSTALWHRSRGNNSLHRPCPAATSWADGDLGHSTASLGQRRSSASSMDTASSLSNAGSCSSEDKSPPSSHRGPEVRDLHPARAPPHPMLAPHCHLSHQGWERTKEPMPPCPMYRLVLAGDGGTGKSSFLLRLCTNEFRGDLSSTLGVDFQIKQLLVDGEQTTLQIWDTAGQER